MDLLAILEYQEHGVAAFACIASPDYLFVLSYTEEN